MTANDVLDGWIPLYLLQGKVHWAYMGQERFVEPFCQDSLQHLARRPFNQLFRPSTSLEVLTDRANSHPGLPLQGIIFHMSRCGSTLVSQSLAALPDSVVLSEPPAVDTVLEWLNAATPDGNTPDTNLLNSVIAALGQPRRPEDKSLFLKTDCWHICHIDRILSAFPDVPWLFLYRNPVEVLVSQMHNPALYLIPGSLIGHGLRPPEKLLTQPLEHGAWVLSQVLNAAVESIQQHPNGLLINYNELPEALETHIAGHFNLHLGHAESSAVKAVSINDSKRPYQPFKADSTSKQADVNDTVKAISNRWLDAPYTRLEQIRLDKAIHSFT